MDTNLYLLSDVVVGGVVVVVEVVVVVVDGVVVDSAKIIRAHTLPHHI